MFRAIALVSLIVVGCSDNNDATTIAHTFLATTNPDTRPSDLRPKDGVTFFPPSFSEPSVRCGFMGRRWNIINDVENDWYPSHLMAADEASLYAKALTARAAGDWTLRFTWLRSFHPSVVIRIDGDSNGAHLLAKELSGAGGYDAGGIVKSVSRRLTKDEKRTLGTELIRTKPFNLPPKVCDIGADGAQWIIEGVDDNGYHFVARWSPKRGGVHDLGMHLLHLTGWNFDEIY